MQKYQYQLSAIEKIKTFVFAQNTLLVEL